MGKWCKKEGIRYAVFTLVLSLAFEEICPELNGDFQDICPLTNASDQETPSTLKVEGVVYCESCNGRNRYPLAGAEPLPGASVGVTCKDSFGYNTAYGLGTTDSNGYFLLYVQNLQLQPDLCKAYLITSSNVSCNVLTDLNNGTTGAYLLMENRLPDSCIYSVGPFAFAPLCASF
eukprot:c14921_g1_i1 orf=220-744(-)